MGAKVTIFSSLIVLYLGGAHRSQHWRSGVGGPCEIGGFEGHFCNLYLRAKHRTISFWALKVVRMVKYSLTDV